MIRFQQRQYTEYDAMRALYVELTKYSNKFQKISPSELIPVLKGNNVVIERFVITTSAFGKDKFRMYLKIGAKAKMPDDVRLAGYRVYDNKLLDLSISFKGGAKKMFSFLETKYFDNSKKQKKDGGGPGIQTEVKLPYFSLNREVRELIGDAIKYDKRDRSLVLEFKDIPSAIRALNILPFGLDYKIYLLDV